MDIGERIRWLRKMKDMTIGELSQKIGVTRQTVSRYETGAIGEIPRKQLEKIAVALDSTVEYLEGWTIDSQKDSILFDINTLSGELEKTESIEDREEIESSIELLKESYCDLSLIKSLAKSQPTPQSKPSPSSGFRIGNKITEWHSDKKADIRLRLDSWLFWVLKGISSEHGRSLEDEIEDVLYNYVSDVVEHEQGEQCPSNQ